jgi:hypothetical protein
VSANPFNTTLPPTQQATQPGVWSSHQTTQAGTPTDIPVTGASGRYVLVQQSGTTLPMSLAEVQVFAGGDLAQGQPATQSSTYSGGVASRAVDGNTDGNWNDGSVTHTTNDAYAWWSVDLGAARSLGDIRIWNRTDCCSDRLSDYWVFVSPNPFNTALPPTQQATQPGVWSSHQTTQAGTPTDIAVPGANGRYVMVQQSGTTLPVSLAEVQVYAGGDIAQGHAAQQSSTLTGTSAYASLAVDGNTDGVFSDGSVTHTNNDPYAWWSVDLGTAQAVGDIRIWNRTDCCSNRLTDYWVFVSASPFNTALTPTQQAAQSGVWSNHQTVQAGTPTDIAVPAATGRYVMVQQSGTTWPMCLAEVQVYAA